MLGNATPLGLFVGPVCFIALADYAGQCRPFRAMLIMLLFIHSPDGLCWVMSPFKG